MTIKYILIQFVLIAFSSSVIAQYYGVESEYYTKNIDASLHKNKKNSFYNLKGEIKEMIEWSYLKDKNGLVYNESAKLHYQFNQNKEIVKRTIGFNEVEYIDYSENLIKSKNKLSSNGDWVDKQVNIFENGVVSGIEVRRKYMNDTITVKYERIVIGDTICIKNRLGGKSYILNGKLISYVDRNEITNYSRNEFGSINNIDIFRNANLIRKDSFSLDGQIVLRLNSNFNSEGNFEYGSIEHFIYNDNILTNVRRYNSSGSDKYIEEEEYHYNDKAQLIEIGINIGKEFERYCYFVYNENGDLVSYSANYSRVKYSNYKYDERGNWIYREEKEDYSDLVNYQEREIIYVK